jgi:hypothetical protein
MSATKRGSLSGFAATKGEAPAAPVPQGEPAPLPVKAKEERKGMTLRLNLPAWRQLKAQAIEEGRPSHNVLIDAVNDYFRKVGKPPIASYNDGE